MFAAIALSMTLAAAAPAPDASAPPPIDAPAAQSITVAAVGDIMLGSSFPDEKSLPPDDARGLLAEVTPLLTRADLALGNLEGPMLDGGSTKKCRPGSKNCYAFRVPTRFGARLKEAGLDVMTLANNHALDFGPEGWASSKRVLDELGIGHTGEHGDIAHLTVKGRKVAVIGFSTYDRMHDLNDLPFAKEAVSTLAQEADFVVVTFHGGAEGAGKLNVPHGREMFLGENRGDLRAFARAVIDAGAALVVGHGPHVPRGLEVYKDRLIAYSLGNFATWEKMNLSGPLGKTLVLEVQLAPDGCFVGGKIHAVKQDDPGGATLDPSGAVIPLIARLSKEDFGAAAPIIEPDGTLKPAAGR